MKIRTSVALVMALSATALLAPVIATAQDQAAQDQSKPAATKPQKPQAKTQKPAQTQHASADPTAAAVPADANKPAQAPKPRRAHKPQPGPTAENGPKPAKIGTNANNTKNNCRMAQNPGKRRFIEFRARTAQSYGHAFIVHGTLSPNGKIQSSEIAGLWPVGDSIVYSIGHFIPVPAGTGPTEGDDDEQYVSARWCIMLSEAEYQRVIAHMKQEMAKSTIWSAPFRNCVTFISDIAEFMGLKLPSSTLLYPEVWVKNLGEINGSTAHTAQTTVPYAQWGLPDPQDSPGSPH